MNGASWWQTGIIYQIYPRSFQDDSADGIGDLRGITRRLPYLVDLGVDAIWLSPIFTSPMADFGYDVADYTDIDRVFGTMADCDALLAAAHACGLKVVLDLVPNHTSDQHRWFVESRSSHHNPKRDWYIWRDPAPDGGPPVSNATFAEAEKLMQFELAAADRETAAAPRAVGETRRDAPRAFVRRTPE